MKRLVTMLGLGFLLASIACGGGGGGGGPTEPLPNPTISSVNPNQARPGDQVTITGSNLGGAQSSVTFAGVAAQVSTASATSIVAIVPNIAAGPATVTITSGGRSGSYSGFSVLAPTPANQAPTLSVTMTIGQQTRSLASVNVNGIATDSDGTVVSITCNGGSLGFNGSFGASFNEQRLVPKDLGMPVSYSTTCTATDDDNARVSMNASVLLPTATGAFHQGLEAAWHAVEVCVSNNQFIQPAPGNKFAVVDVSVASILTNTPPMTVNPFDFLLRDSAGHVFSPTLDCREPDFPLIAVNSGQTVRGWITYEIPANLTQVGLLWTPDFNTTINLPAP